MTFSVQNNTAYINGAKGIYDGKISDNSVRYGRNAASNHYSYIEALKGKPANEQLKLTPLHSSKSNLLNAKIAESNGEKVLKHSSDFINSLPPLDFEYRYMPEGSSANNLDKMALLGSAYEEMGKRLSIPLDELNQKLKLAYNEANSAAVDINRDGHIDTAEYSTTILGSDMLSKNPEQMDAKNINGLVNKTGLNTIFAYTNPKNYAAANKSFTDIYNTFNLGEAQKAFAANQNNILDVQA